MANVLTIGLSEKVEQEDCTSLSLAQSLQHVHVHDEHRRSTNRFPGDDEVTKAFLKGVVVEHPGHGH